MFEMNNAKNEIIFTIGEMEEIYKILLNCGSEYHGDYLSNASIKDPTKSVESNLDEIFANLLLPHTGYTTGDNYNKDDLDEEMEGILAIMKSNNKGFEIQLNPLNAYNIKQTMDNKILFDLLLEKKEILRKKYSNLANSWIRIIMRNWTPNDAYIGEILNSAVSIKATIDTNIDKYLKFAGENQLIIHDYHSDSEDDSDFEQVDIDETAQSLGYEFTDPLLPSASFIEPGEYFANDFFNTEKNETSSSKPIAGQKLPTFDDFSSSDDLGEQVRPIKPVSWNALEKQNEIMSSDFNIKDKGGSLNKNTDSQSQDKTGTLSDKSKTKKPRTDTGKLKSTQYSRLNNIMKKGKRKF
ncbi:hypothetical protein AYI69_g6306 [Smittium culicis]|uniref:Uncharacterized protein n=1 Tax=Smittium culicis TaxID=133412 RepID=A0A1R1XZU4_9FUNG|nr:hypothetical protein AYI69_g6306 [Smittium culicis]